MALKAQKMNSLLNFAADEEIMDTINKTTSEAVEKLKAKKELEKLADRVLKKINAATDTD